MVEVVPQVPARCDTAVKLHRNLFLNNFNIVLSRNFSVSINVRHSYTEYN